MTVHLLIAPASHGKTQHAIDHIRAIKASEPFAPITVILPNQIRAAEFQARLAASGGALRVDLATFHTLYAEVLARAGQPRARLIDVVQVRLLRVIVDHLCDAGRLPHYAPLRDKPGFVAALRDTIEELKRARIQPDVFFSAVMGLGRRLEELAAIYDEYQRWLQREDWADAEGQGWLAAIALEQHPNLGRELRLLVVNGFDEFNPTQVSVLTLLARRAQQTLITLTGDTARARLAHRRFLRAQQMLSAALGVTPEPAPANFEIQNADLSALETGLFESPQSPGYHHQAPTSGQPSVEFVEAQNRSEAARAALRWIKTCVVRDGMALAEVAVLARDLDAYRPFLEEVAAEFGLPLRAAGGVPLIDNPAVAALISLLSLPVADWPRRPILEAWRSPYFDWTPQRIGSADAAALDAISRAGRVSVGLPQWREAFALAACWQPPEASLDDEDVPFSSLPFGTSQEVEAKFDAFIDVLSPPPQATIREYAAFVEDLIGGEAGGSHLSDEDGATEAGIGVAARTRQNPATAPRDLAALRAFKDVLRGLVLAETTLSTPSAVTYRAFIEELRGAVGAVTYSPASHPMVEERPVRAALAASVLDARGLSFRAVVLLGLSEGEFPQAEREDILLREDDRAALRERGLPIEPKLRGDEVSFFYQAVTRARERLLLCRPYLADDGQPWEPSPYWLQAWSVLGQPPIHRVRPEDPLPPDAAASPVEFIRAGLRGDPHLERGVTILRARLASSPPKAQDQDEAAAYEGDLTGLAGQLAARYSPAHGWSASRLEVYAACPFFFYIANALGLEPRTPPEEGYDARILGSMLHKILEETYRRAADPVDVDACLQALPDVAKLVFDGAPAEYGFRPSPVCDAQRRELETIVRGTITALAEISQGYTPYAFEQRFGLGQPPLALRAGDDEIRLRGYIDRLDMGPDGRLRVIDYKASGTSIRPQHLAEGRRLQLPVYALAARDALGLGQIGSGFYWHIQKAERSSLRLEDYPGGIEAAFETAAHHVFAHVRSIRAGQFPPVPPAEGCPDYCPATGFCWRYSPRVH